MEIRYTSLLITLINFALIIAIILGIFKVIKEVKSFINRSKQIDKKLDIILDELRKRKDA